MTTQFYQPQPYQQPNNFQLRGIVSESQITTGTSAKGFTWTRLAFNLVNAPNAGQKANEYGTIYRLGWFSPKIQVTDGDLVIITARLAGFGPVQKPDGGVFFGNNVQIIDMQVIGQAPAPQPVPQAQASPPPSQATGPVVQSQDPALAINQ